MTFVLAMALLLAEPEPATILPPSQVSLAEAGRAIAAGRLDQATEMMRVAVAAGARGEPIDRLLADLAFTRNENEQALALYLGLLANHTDETLLLERAGIAALRLGRLSQATSLLDRATRSEPASWRSWNARGVAADRQGRWDEADAAYARAAQRGPDRAEIPNNQGWSLMLRGQWAEALVAFERASSIDPRLPRLSNNLELARAAVAADLPRRISGESDDDFAARLNDAGVVSLADGQHKRAEAAFSQAIALKSRWFARAADNLAVVAPAK
ncbi:MAG TPA: tetratricopeptide repeat protein [Sphingomicrobium sp.]|nr:tetratricopeptide repeat protein [Sphingomicrobium sp.]